MRVSEHFAIDRQQASLDFVDVDVEDDVQVFVDPRALRLLPSQWGAECVSLVQHFFRTIILAIKEDQHDRAQSLLAMLREPNETHLGLSFGRSRGRAIGEHSAHDIWNALRKSEAVRSGLIEDLEDTILMVEGIDKDIVSDITTNLIREPLIHYTQDACAAYGIPLQPDVSSGPVWNPTTEQWDQSFVALPVVDARRLLLIPKVIVRQRMNYEAGEYYRHYILESLRDEELAKNSNLVGLLKSGERRVTLKSLKEKYGTGKQVIVRETLRRPELLRRYRDDKSSKISSPLSHLDLSIASGAPPPDWDALLAALRSVKPGREHAGDYEKAIEKLLTALAYPALTNPESQVKIHEGRKRIDITFVNVANGGFFGWLAQHHPAGHIFIECKNYSTEVSNPELDQLTSRFSPSRGRFGLLVCRQFEDKTLFIQRCIDSAKDDRGFVVPVDDDDLALLVAAAKVPGGGSDFELLFERFKKLVF